MWLLNTSTAELRSFPDASHIERGGFAILSHTWGDNEQTFQDVQSIIEDCRKSGLNPRDHVSDKIRNCCMLAERHKYDWVWIDSCCIDKTSSTELSEAISSMYRWYQQADVCYAYLADVSTGDSLDVPDSEFRRSRWHTRGWTLQELIAPSSVLFYSKDWTFLGTRSQLNVLLSVITGVWPQILDRTCGAWQASIAVRMLWASERRTTRIEDEAYCLFGLFGVDMPIMYGEGRRAFYRLQLEILKSSPDTSLFAWGPFLSHGAFKDKGYERLLQRMNHNTRGYQYQYLLADSPAHFQFFATSYTPYCSTPLQSRAEIQRAITNKSNLTTERNNLEAYGSPEGLQFRMTSQGMKCTLPMVEARGLTVGILLCEDHSKDEHLPVASSSSRYTACAALDNGHHLPGTHLPCRILGLGRDLHNIQLWGQRVKPVWRTVYIDPYPPHWQSPYNISPQGKPLRDIARPCDVPFRIPNWLITKLTMAVFAFSGVLNIGGSYWQLYFHNRLVYDAEEIIHVSLGLCSLATNGTGSHRPRPWVTVTLSYHGDHRATKRRAGSQKQHVCPEDHLEAWRPAFDKRFGDEERTVRISFRPDTLDGPNKLVMHLELEGTVYAEMLRDARVRIPTREELDASQEVSVTTTGPLHEPSGIEHTPSTPPSLEASASTSQQCATATSDRSQGVAWGGLQEKRMAWRALWILLLFVFFRS